MPEPKPVQPPRFVVQCAKGKGWKSLVIDESQPAAERAFREVVKVNPRAYFRLIRLDDNPNSEIDGQDFTWKLLMLHDPKKSASGTSRTARSSRPTPPPGERVGIPLRLYGLAVVLGVILALVLFIVYGPSLSSPRPLH